MTGNPRKDIKTNIIVILAPNPHFTFLQDLKNKNIKERNWYKSMLIGILYKDVIDKINNITQKG